MADVWYSLAGSGTGTGADAANAKVYVEATMQTDMDTAITAGFNLYVSNEVYVMANGLDIDTNHGTDGSPVSAIGYNISTGLVDGSKAIFDANSVSARCVYALRNNVQLKHIEFINATSDAFVSGTYANGLVYNCNMENSNDGINGTVGNASFIHCTVAGNTADAIQAASSNTKFHTCCFITTAGGVTAAAAIEEFNNCLFYKFSTFGGLGKCDIIHCTIDDFTTGPSFGGGGDGSKVMYNLFTNISGVALTCGTSVGVGMNNGFYNNGTNISNSAGTQGSFYIFDSLTLTADPYTDRTGGDFTVDASAGASEGVDVAVPIGALDEATNISYITLGAITPAHGGGSSTRRMSLKVHGV